MSWSCCVPQFRYRLALTQTVAGTCDSNNCQDGDDDDGEESLERCLGLLEQLEEQKANGDLAAG